jgi:hypothetical protein
MLGTDHRSSLDRITNTSKLDSTINFEVLVITALHPEAGATTTAQLIWHHEIMLRQPSLFTCCVGFAILVWVGLFWISARVIAGLRCNVLTRCQEIPLTSFQSNTQTGLKAQQSKFKETKKIKVDIKSRV